ncbi:spore germination lipase LipC [Pullulanibacillus camelliae]|uniref:Spore germination lipase LipC n=1 Tax=Pullulanibacillus camelliae TaxID=1707096 RepID=A0A8J2VSM1_9BACL|nr:GDSL-type esterase/lipase family protein [Pullulanibacillus camelliae]GGE37483.1 spore germination lipase LipC [Pullulanibacillus camelliae]
MTHPILYAALGDSLTVGIGSDLFFPGFIGYYQHALQHHLKQPVAIQSIARVGATAMEILEATTFVAICKSLQHAQVITVTAGANDLIDAGKRFLIDHDLKRLQNALEASVYHVGEIIRKIHKLHEQRPAPYILRVFNIYNPFPELPEANMWIERFNHELLSYASHPNTKIADIDTAFAGKQKDLLVPGDVHPNVHGYKVMADVLKQLGYAPLST